MRLLDTKTRYFDQDTFQIPQLENAWGAMINVLDTALAKGSNFQDVLGLTVSEDLENPDLYWLLNVRLAEGHGFKKNVSVIEIVNSNISVFNGLFRVQDITNTSITLALSKLQVPIQPSNLVYLVGVQIRTPPLGYEKAFEGSNKAVYKVVNDSNKIAYLRVDNSCPDGYNPSWAKFSRVSMFSDMEHIDDYTFRLGRLKAPATAKNYNSVEEDRSAVWLAVRNTDTAHVYKATTTLISRVEKFIIIGDNKTFYLLEESILHNNLNYIGDFLYTFGEYKKNMYKEDPYPFLLHATIKHDPEYYSMYNKYEHFRGDNELGKFLFNPDTTYNFLAESSDYWSLWLTEIFRSGSSDRINFKPYKNEITYSIMPNIIRSHRKEGIFLEGILRGVYSFAVNFKDTPELIPPHREILNIDKNLYLTTSVKDYLNQDIKFAFALSNWS